MYRLPGNSFAVRRQVSGLILDELKNYFYHPEYIQMIAGEPGYPYTDAELQLADELKLESLLPDPVMDDLELILQPSSYKYNPIDFINRKFLQLVRIAKSDNSYVPDIFGEMLLMAIAGNAPVRSGEASALPEEWKEFAAGEAGEDDESIRKEVYDSLIRAGYGLGNLYHEEMKLPNGLLIYDTDYLIPAGRGLIEGFTILLGSDAGYTPEEMYEIFTSVGYRVPGKIAALPVVMEI